MLAEVNICWTRASVKEFLPMRFPDARFKPNGIEVSPQSNLTCVTSCLDQTSTDWGLEADTQSDLDGEQVYFATLKVASPIVLSL